MFRLQFCTVGRHFIAVAARAVLQTMSMEKNTTGRAVPSPNMLIPSHAQLPLSVESGKAVPKKIAALGGHSAMANSAPSRKLPGKLLPSFCIVSPVGLRPMDGRLMHSSTTSPQIINTGL